LSKIHRTACSFLIERVFKRQAIVTDCLHFCEKSDNRTMYKALTLIILVVIGAACASGSFNKNSHKFQQLSSSFEEQKVGIDLCPACINEAVDLINVILNVILDEGILATCGAVCGAVENKTDSRILGDLCAIACEALGIDEFVKLIIRADIDPIYYCQLVDMCPSKTNLFHNFFF
jgi:hypothetical protein